MSMSRDLQLGRREVLKVLGVLGTPWGVTSARSDSTAGVDTDPTLNRFATTASGAEITGLFLTDDGTLFFNVQHPDDDNMWWGYRHGGVGVVQDTSLHDLPRDFGSVQTPTSDSSAEMVRTAAGTHSVLRNGGDDIGDGERLGVPTTPDGEPLTDADTPDFNGFIPANDAGDEGYLFTNWETRPGAVSRMHVRREGGRWTVVDAMNVDFRDVEGTWVNCFGTVSPWETPLTSEENYAHTSTAHWNDPEWDYVDGVENLERYLGHYPNPYRYGYIVEITEPESEDPTPEKRFAIGRSAHENAVVMPDERTVYTSSDGTGKHLYKFVADEAQDLSSGTLYAASASQDGRGDPADVGFDLEWVELGHASDDEIAEWVAEYDGISQADYADGETSYITDAEVTAWANGNADDDRVAFLESRKAAEVAGATSEFRKMEGINIRPDAEPGDYMYVAMSAVSETMADDEGDIQLRGNEYGAVYRMQLRQNYDVDRMEPVVTGGPDANICGGCPYDADPNSNESVCQDCGYNPQQDEEGAFGFGELSLSPDQDPENTIANPDNVVVMPDGRVIIGEDTGFHDNNMIWVYDPADG